MSRTMGSKMNSTMSRLIKRLIKRLITNHFPVQQSNNRTHYDERLMRSMRRLKSEVWDYRPVRFRVTHRFKVTVRSYRSAIIMSFLHELLSWAFSMSIQWKPFNMSFQHKLSSKGWGWSVDCGCWMLKSRSAIYFVLEHKPDQANRKWVIDSVCITSSLLHRLLTGRTKQTAWKSSTTRWKVNHFGGLIVIADDWSPMLYLTGGWLKWLRRFC